MQLRRGIPFEMAVLAAVVALRDPASGVAAQSQINIDWQTTLRTLITQPACQVVVNPLITRESPIHDAVYDSIRQLVTGATNLGPIRYVPWLPYPRLGVGELEPPSGGSICGFRASEETEFPLVLTCPSGVISTVTFASYGTPSGFCNALTLGACNAPTSKKIVEAACVGKASCSLLSNSSFFGGDPCVGTAKSLAVQIECSVPTNNTYWDFSVIDPLMEDFMNATKGHDVIINFSTPPQWLYNTSRVAYPDDPLGETWGYEQGAQLLDPSATQFGQYYGRLLAWYTDGGFTDEAGVRHDSGHLYNISHWECLNEVESEHSNSPQSYTITYDAMTKNMQVLAPRGTHNMQWVGLALEGHNEWDWYSYFLNASNHAPGTPLDWVSMHFYASCSSRTDPSTYTNFFDDADNFVTEMTTVVQQYRDVLNPSVKLDADELGVILPDDNDPNAAQFPTIYWNAAAGMYAYLFGKLAVVGVEVLGESQLVGYPNLPEYGWPPQFPSVAMLNWTTGAGTARYWVLKLLADSTVLGDAIVLTKTSSPVSNPFCGEIVNLSNLTLTCVSGTISGITFADYGTVQGTCPSYTKGACTDANATTIVESFCLGKATCTVPAVTSIFGDPCYGTVKYLKVVATCSSGGGFSPSGQPVYAQAFSSAADGKGKVLIVNKSFAAQSVALPGATNGVMQYVDESSADGPPASLTLTSDTFILAPYAVAVVFMP